MNEREDIVCKLIIGKESSAPTIKKITAFAISCRSSGTELLAPFLAF